MLSYAYFDEIEKLNKFIQSKQLLLQVVGDLTTFYNRMTSIQESIFRIAYGLNATKLGYVEVTDWEGDRKQIQRLVPSDEMAEEIYIKSKLISEQKEKIEKRILEYKTQSLFIEITSFEKELIDFLASNAGEQTEEPLKELQNSLMQFSKGYEDHLKRQLDIFDLSKLAKALSSQIQYFNYFFHSLRRIQRYSTPQGSENSKRITLQLDSDLELFEIADKALAIQIIYIELCALINISPKEYPLSVIKLESGSLLTDILGYPKIIDFMEKIIIDGITYIYMNFTRHGKYAQIPRRVEEVEKILLLRNKLQDAGIVTTGLDEQINKSTVIIAKNLNVLLLKEAKITLNRKEYSIEKKNKQKFLEETKHLALPAPKIDENWNEEYQ